MKKTIAIIGAGFGISKATALYFGKNGYSVLLIGRTTEKLKTVVDDLKSEAIEADFLVADVANVTELSNALHAVKNLSVLHYNAFAARATNILNETEEFLLNDFKVNVVGLLTAVKVCLPSLENNSGSILVTGGGLSKYPHPDYASLSIGKAAQANLANSLSQALSPKNIFVGLLQINGFVNEQDATYNPANIAARLWEINTQRTDFENII